jgi:chorismate mutase
MLSDHRLEHLLDSGMTHWLRGIRGATTVERDEPGLILEATRELLSEMLAANGIDDFEPIAGIFFTTTPDLKSTFPAEAARQLGMNLVPLLCNQEIPVPGRLERAVRVMMQVNTPRAQAEMQHVYLREAKALRPDLVSAQ